MDPATEQEATILTACIGSAFSLAVAFGVHLTNPQLDAIKTIVGQLVPLGLIIFARHAIANAPPAKMVLKAIRGRKSPAE